MVETDISSRRAFGGVCVDSIRRTEETDPTPTPTLVRLIVRTTLLVLAVAAGAFLLAGPAAAKDPCWKTLIDDWYDGRIDSVYPVACYRAALEHMPEDVAQYSSLGDDINRALQAAIASQGSDGGSNGSSTGSPDPTTRSRV